MKPQIKYNWFGIASRQGNTIWLNANLKKYPPLHNRILMHELEHSSGFTWNDFLMDCRNSHLKGLKKQYYKFVLTHPRSWIEFLPFWVYDGALVINPLVLMLYGLTISIMGVIGWVLG